MSGGRLKELSTFNLSILLGVKMEAMELLLLTGCNLEHAYVDIHICSSTISLTICLVKLLLTVIAFLALHPLLKLSFKMD